MKEMIGMPEERQQPTEYNYTQKQITLALVALFAVYGMMAYLMQCLGNARPKIAADLNGIPLYAWAISIPSLISAIATLIFGKFSDVYGRRRMLLISLSFSAAGTILSAVSPTFKFLIVAGALGAIGTGAMMPLVFSVVGDLFPPSGRGKWIGLMNIPTGIFAVLGPPLGGWFVDHWGWRWIYWMAIPLLILCFITVPFGVPSIRRAVKIKIDVLGLILIAIASSTAIIGFSFAGDRYPWGSPVNLALLGISLLCWILFFQTEFRVQEPILDPLVFRNRSFLTVSIAGMLSFFGQMAIMMYFPMFLQGTKHISTTNSGWITMIFSAVVSFVGIPMGFILSRTKRYKGLYLLSYGILTAVMFRIIFFAETTPIGLCWMTLGIAGIGMGAIPIMNTMVVQNAVPKRLLGVAMGANFFCLLMGLAISPAILDSARNAAYARNLEISLPEGLKQAADKETIRSLCDPKVLLSKHGMDEFRSSFKKMGMEETPLFQQTDQAIRRSFEKSLGSAYWVGAVAMLLALLLIGTLPKTSMAAGAKDVEAIIADNSGIK
jgi:MFS family permease